MFVFSMSNAALFVIGIVLFNGQVGLQFAVDGVSQSGLDAMQFDQHLPVVQKAAVCEGSAGSNKCVKIRSKCYCYVNQQLTWLKAFEFCKSYHMNLISIESTKEQEDVTTVLMPIVLNDTVATKTGGIWTAGTSVPALDTYYWATVQRIFAFANWFFGQPSTNDDSPQCVRIMPTPEATWATSSCKNSYLPFICEDYVSIPMSL